MLTAQTCWLIGQQGLGHFFKQRILLPIGWNTLQTVQWKTHEAPTKLETIRDAY
jgi:hypothetical protein